MADLENVANKIAGQKRCVEAYAGTDRDFTDPLNALAPLSNTPAKYKAIAQEVIGVMMKKGKFLYDADNVKAYSRAYYFDNDARQMYTIQSNTFHSWLTEKIGTNRGEPSWPYMIKAIEDAALSSQSKPVIPQRFWSCTDTATYITCGLNRLVKASAKGVELVKNGCDEQFFVSDRILNTWELTDPLDPVKNLLMFTKASFVQPWMRTVMELWMVAMFTKQANKPFLLLTGGPGSGKTRASKSLMGLVGMPVPRNVEVSDKKIDDFWLAAHTGGLFNVDNLDYSVKEVVETFNIYSTGGMMQRRTLYSNDDETLFRNNSWITITAAEPRFGASSALVDRLFLVQLHQRTQMDNDEAALELEVQQHRSAVLSWIAHQLAKAYAIPNEKYDVVKRFPDFASWCMRYAKANDRVDEIKNTLQMLESLKPLFNIMNHFVGQLFYHKLACGWKFEGNARELLDDLRGDEDGVAILEGWNSIKLTKQLDAIWQNLSAIAKCDIIKKGTKTEYRFMGLKAEVIAKHEEKVKPQTENFFDEMLKGGR